MFFLEQFEAGYSLRRRFLHLAAVKQAYVALRCKCEPARLLSQATCPNSAFAQNTKNTYLMVGVFFNTLPNKQSRIFA